VGRDPARGGLGRLRSVDRGDRRKSRCAGRRRGLHRGGAPLRGWHGRGDLHRRGVGRRRAVRGIGSRLRGGNGLRALPSGHAPLRRERRDGLRRRRQHVGALPDLRRCRGRGLRSRERRVHQPVRPGRRGALEHRLRVLGGGPGQRRELDGRSAGRLRRQRAVRRRRRQPLRYLRLRRGHRPGSRPAGRAAQPGAGRPRDARSGRPGHLLPSAVGRGRGQPGRGGQRSADRAVAARVPHQEQHSRGGLPVQSDRAGVLQRRHGAPAHDRPRPRVLRPRLAAGQPDFHGRLLPLPQPHLRDDRRRRGRHDRLGHAELRHLRRGRSAGGRASARGRHRRRHGDRVSPRPVRRAQPRERSDAPAGRPAARPVRHHRSLRSSGGGVHGQRPRRRRRRDDARRVERELLRGAHGGPGPADQLAGHALRRLPLADPQSGTTTA
jgi:hypothetical protein